MRTERENLLILMVPTALVVAVYIFGFYRPGQQELARLQEDYQTTQRSEVTPQQVLTAEANLTIAKTKRDETAQQITLLEQETDKLCASFGDATQRFETVARITDRITGLIKQNQVSLISQSVVKDPTIPVKTEEALKTIEKKNGGRKMQFRRFSMQGRYDDMLTLVTNLSKEVEVAFPISIELDTKKSVDEIHTWHLLIVM